MKNSDLLVELVREYKEKRDAHIKGVILDIRFIWGRLWNRTHVFNKMLKKDVEYFSIASRIIKRFLSDKKISGKLLTELIICLKMHISSIKERANHLLFSATVLGIASAFYFSDIRGVLLATFIFVGAFHCERLHINNRASIYQEILIVLEDLKNEEN